MSVEVIRVVCWNDHDAVKVGTFLRDAGTWTIRIAETDQLPDVDPPPAGITQEWVEYQFQVEKAEPRFKVNLQCPSCPTNCRVTEVDDLVPLLEKLATMPPGLEIARHYERVNERVIAVSLGELSKRMSP